VTLLTVRSIPWLGGMRATLMPNLSLNGFYGAVVELGELSCQPIT